MCGSAWVERRQKTRARRERGAVREGDRDGRPGRHDQEQQPGGQGDPAHPRQVLDDGHGAGHGSGRQDGLEQVHPVGRIAERQQVRGDEAQDHVGRVAGGMGGAEHRTRRPGTRRVPGEDARAPEWERRARGSPRPRRAARRPRPPARDSGRRCARRRPIAAVRPEGAVASGEPPVRGRSSPAKDHSPGRAPQVDRDRSGHERHQDPPVAAEPARAERHEHDARTGRSRC